MSTVKAPISSETKKMNTSREKMKVSDETTKKSAKTIEVQAKSKIVEDNAKPEAKDDLSPKKQRRKFVKPKQSRKMGRELKKKVEKEIITVDPVLEREKLRLQRHELNAMEKRWMAKKEMEFNKKISELTKDNQQLKASEEVLMKENEIIRNDRNYKELELEKLTQFWTITRAQLQQQQQQAVDLEARMQRLKVAHVEHVSLLHKRIAMLQLDTKLELEMSTQTDPFGLDSDCTGRADMMVQTESDWDRQKVNDVLKQHDDELVAFIAEIENAKQQAQSDYKFAVVQLEQGLREEHEDQLRTIKEEKERQLEEMVRIQCEQMTQVENDKMHLKASLTGVITDQKVEIQELNKSLAKKEEECVNLTEDLQAIKNQYENLTTKFKALTLSYEKNKVDTRTLKNDLKTIADLRIRLEKIEDINEILLGEYKKLETERNMVAEQLAYLMKTGVESGSRGSNRSAFIASLAPQKKSYEIGEQLGNRILDANEIRRKYAKI
ncbi:hypothetical protein M3Y96_00698200 [Aphelenchoides besseyi]|nr:hypothetical protein M3Y96_00698200 [Aphelenchoides besseyi]